VRKFQTVKALAELFGKHENTIYKWILEDQLFPHAFQVKGNWYVLERDLRRVYREGRAAATDRRRST
jgi:hypothetical protein